MEFEWNGVTLSVNFYGQFIRTDYPCHIAYVQPPPPLRKKSKKGCLWGRGKLHAGQSQTDKPFLMRFGSRGPIEFFFSDTPPKCPD